MWKCRCAAYTEGGRKRCALGACALIQALCCSLTLIIWNPWSEKNRVFLPNYQWEIFKLLIKILLNMLSWFERFLNHYRVWLNWLNKHSAVRELGGYWCSSLPGHQPAAPSRTCSPTRRRIATPSGQWMNSTACPVETMANGPWDDLGGCLRNNPKLALSAGRLRTQGGMPHVDFSEIHWFICLAFHFWTFVVVFVICLLRLDMITFSMKKVSNHFLSPY